MLFPSSPPEAMRVAGPLIVLLSAAAAATSHLNCSVTKSQDGSFRYQIPENPNSPKCITSWEDRNGTVIVDILGKFDGRLVMNHTLHSVELKDCQDFLLHKRECGGVQLEVSCSVNCSLFVVKNLHPPSRICLSLNICTDIATAGIIAAANLSIFLLLLLLPWMVRKWRSGGCRCARRFYDPPSNQAHVQMEMEEKGRSKTPQ